VALTSYKNITEPKAQMEPCWLCHFNHTTDAKTLSAYIAENMGCASTASIAGQVETL